MMKHLTSGLRMSTVKRKLSRFIFNLMLAMFLLMYVILRILFWPLRLLYKGLAMSAEWMCREWRA